MLGEDPLGRRINCLNRYLVNDIINELLNDVASQKKS